MVDKFVELEDADVVNRVIREIRSGEAEEN